MLRHRNFRLLWAGETVSGAGTAMAATGMPLLAVTVLRASTFAVAAITAAAYLPWLVIGLPAGAADPYLRPLTLYGTAANLAYTGSTALLVVFLVRAAGFGPAAVGGLLAVGSVGGVAGATTARRLACLLGSARALLLSVLIAGVFSLLIPLTGTGPRAACCVVGSAGASAGIAVGNVIIGSFRQAYCPPSMLGRITAGMRVLVFGGIPAGALLAGWLATVLGTRAALWVVLASFAVSGTLLLTPSMMSERCLPSTCAAALSSRVKTGGVSGRRRRRVPRAGIR